MPKSQRALHRALVKKITPTPDQADRARHDAANGMNPPPAKPRNRRVPWRGKRGGGRGMDPHNYGRWNDRPTNS